MNLIEYYVPLRQVHMTAVAFSLALFAARGAAVLAGRSWPMRRTPRVASVLIDTVLLGCGIALWTALGLNPLRETWLGAKLVLLLAYVGLGSYALKRAPTRRARAGFYVAALLCVAFMVSIALAHHPAGAWRLLVQALPHS